MAHNMSGTGGTGGFFRGESSSGDGRIPNPVIQDDDNLEATLHQLAIDAYRGVLIFFSANDSVLSSEQENLLTNLRAEMGITSVEHSSILASATTDLTVQLIRSLRESRGQYATHDTSQLVHNLSTPSTSGTGGPVRSFPTESTANQPSTSAGTVVGTDRNFPTSGEGSGQFGSHLSSGGRVNELVGRRVRTTRDGRCFYEGVITDYNPHEGTHTITYELPNGRVVDSVNLAQIPHGWIQWLSNDAGTLHHGGYGAPERAMNQATGAQSRNDLPPPQHPRVGSVETQTLDIRSLVMEAERVARDSNSTPQDRARAANKLREQEQYLAVEIEWLEVIADETDDDADEEMNDPVLLPPQEITGPDENLILVTDSVLTEAERVMSDSNSTAQERAGTEANMILVTDSVLTEAERIMRDSNSTAVEKRAALQLALDLLKCELTNEERDRAYNITTVFKQQRRDANEPPY